MYITKESDKDITPCHLTLYTTALCNLKCSYCYICKDNSNILKKIDDDIKEDWETDRYISRMKKDFPPNYLNSIFGLDLWGGETLIGMDRFINSFEKIQGVLPNLQSIQFSTNFVVPHTIEILEELFNKISKNVNFPFKIYLQISIDGPEEINDLNRGKGVTKKILDNFNQLLSLYIPENIIVDISTKPTLSRDTFSKFLDYDFCKEYYAFFSDNFYKPYYNNVNTRHNINNLYCGIPNYAEPFNYTQQDGLTLTEIFKNFAKVGREEKLLGFENRSLVPYVGRFGFKKEWLYEPIGYMNGGACGKLINDITMVPHDRYCVCHRSLFDSYVDYMNTKKDNTEMKYDDFMASSRATLSKEEFFKVRKALIQQYLYPNKQIKIDTDLMIKLTARAGQIQEKYLESKERLPVLNFMSTLSMCLDSNYRSQGSLYVQPFWWIRLLLNGAFDIMIEEIERYS